MTALSALLTKDRLFASNANGKAYRFPSGLQICVRKFVVTQSLVNAFGQYMVPDGAWVFPAPFIATPDYLHVDPVEADSGYFYARPTGANASGFNQLYLTNTANAAYNSPVNLVGAALGAWK